MSLRAFGEYHTHETIISSIKKLKIFYGLKGNLINIEERRGLSNVILPFTPDGRNYGKKAEYR